MERTLPQLQATLEKVASSFELVLIDDGSSDQTWQLLRAFAGEFEHPCALRFSSNFGKEVALFARIQTAPGQAALILAGDQQHPPEIIPEMVALWRDQGYCVVEGVKEDQGKEGSLTKYALRLFYRLLRLVSGLNQKKRFGFQTIGSQSSQCTGRIR